MARAEKRKFHYIYKTTCSVTNKFYIGMHSTDSLEDGYLGSGKLLWYSIRKYGKENHSTEILEFLSSREELKLREAQIVSEELLGEKLCMNLRIGGEGGGGFEHLSREQLLIACSLGGKAKTKSLEKDSALREKLRDMNSQRMSETNQKYNLGGDTFSGRIHSTVSKNKISESCKGKQSGEKNSQFGKCWIYSIEQQQSIKIPKEELEAWQIVGWIKGRKIFT